MFIIEGLSGFIPKENLIINGRKKLIKRVAIVLAPDECCSRSMISPIIKPNRINKNSDFSNR
ncbi:hypothetical protein OAG81_00690 [Flavobacteriaceae bacterium]|nr:hypothetical protein [Flavobacteriaceae bacterium]